jgi:hypothetical protein
LTLEQTLHNPGRQQRQEEKKKEERLLEAAVEAEKEKPRERTAAEAASEDAHLFESTPSETEAVEILLRNRVTAMDGSSSEDDGDVTLQGSPPN